MVEFFKKKGVGYILNIVALAMGIVALICYLVSGEDKSYMTPTYVEAIVYVPIIVGIVLNIVVLFYSNSLVKIFAFIAYFLSLCMWIYNQAGYIVNVMMGIDGNHFGFAYILAVVAMVVAMVLSLLSAFKFKKKATQQTVE